MLEKAAAESRLHRPDLEVHVVVQPEGLVLDGDEERLHQVVANLIENAARHSPPGKPIDVMARGGTDRVVIEVADAGPGIPEDERVRVFERFYRADRSRGADQGGAGLGLAISQWIADLHGGSIRAEGRVPTGCRMVVELPAAP
jgi:signal transduction histidine kinase